VKVLVQAGEKTQTNFLEFHIGNTGIPFDRNSEGVTTQQNPRKKKRKKGGEKERERRDRGESSG
jgi:hypothetical protein